MFEAAVAAADPAKVVPPHLPLPPRGRTLVLAAGKAAASMARAVEQCWPNDIEGIAVTRYGHGVDCRRIEVVEAGHPLPDAAGQGAASRFLSAAARLGCDDLLLFLLSGGASALLVEPQPGLNLDDKRAINRALLEAGAPIGEMNCLRKHLSAVKGGRLAAAAAPARVVTLAISDVPGDDPAIIGSGPTAADLTSCADALAVADRYDIALPEVARTALEQGTWETPRPADVLAAAAAMARTMDFEVVNLGADIQGEARDIGAAQAELARQHAPSVVISGGETTVTISAPGGVGGPNLEYLLALVLALEGAPNVHAIACDTDGLDGSAAAAGAYIGPDTLARARASGMDPRDMLTRHDSYKFFQQLGDLVVTGPTRTNVNDLRAVLIT
ncbi:Putative hydroxypyruvate reductase [Geodia barretti]|uniref:Hydroxypyruvate reductase n=1 Tax=Geodia barretti TaxID=519541 RepID=A0AA35X0B2_GEOBA|nr:Putative hydroxypyruvate reductase [Geodia barretti]